MVDAIGEMKVKHETSTVEDHLRDLGQLCGFIGSSAPVHVTCVLSGRGVLFVISFFAFAGA
jgi:hypothetical protein